MDYTKAVQQVSIHAPVRERHTPETVFNASAVGFNSRSREGATSKLPKLVKCNSFNSRSREGATP